MIENIIVIDIKSGIIEVMNIPKDIVVMVRDFDVEGTEEEKLTKTDDGLAIITIHSSNGQGNLAYSKYKGDGNENSKKD